VARLDRLIVYGLIADDAFTLNEVLELLEALGYAIAPERVKESLTRLELAFVVGHSRDRFRGQVLAGRPAKMLEP